MFFGRVLFIINQTKLKPGSRVLTRYFKLKSSGYCVTTTSQLATLLNRPSWHNYYRVLDAQWDLCGENYKEKHIANRILCSKYFSIDECRDHNSRYPRMLPSEQNFADYVSELGISNNHHVIIYDNHHRYPMYSAPRVWWMFRVFGHEDVSVLDGGLRKWISCGNSVAQGPYSDIEMLPKPKKKFTASLVSSLVKDFDWMKENCHSKNPVQVIDARSRLRYLGYNKEGEVEASGGHIPSSFSTPYPGLMDEQKNFLHGKDYINKYFTDCGVDITKDAVASCGSGISACILSIGLHYSSGKEVPVYDASWSEWKERADKEDLVKGIKS